MTSGHRYRKPRLTPPRRCKNFLFSEKEEAELEYLARRTETTLSGALRKAVRDAAALERDREKAGMK